MTHGVNNLNFLVDVDEPPPIASIDENEINLENSEDELRLLQKCLDLMQQKFTSVFHHQNYLSPSHGNKNNDFQGQFNFI